jgi:hypothetical protein
MPHVVRFYGMLKNSWSPTGINRLNSHFLRPSRTRSRDISGDGQSALVDKLGVSSSRSRLPRSTSLSPGDRVIGPRPQFWDDSLTPSQQPISRLQCFDRNAVFIFSRRMRNTEGKIGCFSHNVHHVTSQVRVICVFKSYRASRRETAEEILLL